VYILYALLYKQPCKQSWKPRIYDAFEHVRIRDVWQKLYASGSSDGCEALRCHFHRNNSLL